MSADYTPDEVLAIANAEVELEGLTANPAADEALLAFAAGEIDGDDMMTITRVIASE